MLLLSHLGMWRVFKVQTKESESEVRNIRTIFNIQGQKWLHLIPDYKSMKIKFNGFQFASLSPAFVGLMWSNAGCILITNLPQSSLCGSLSPIWSPFSSSTCPFWPSDAKRIDIQGFTFGSSPDYPHKLVSLWYSSWHVYSKEGATVGKRKKISWLLQLNTQLVWTCSRSHFPRAQTLPHPVWAAPSHLRSW